MKNNFFIILYFLLFSNCSFDNKSGIWIEGQEIKKKAEDKYSNKNLKDVFTSRNLYNKEQKVNSDYIIQADKVYQNKNWTEEFQNFGNNISNIYLINDNKLVSKSSKLTKGIYSDSYEPLFYKDHIISYDNKGTIYIYSIEKKKKLLEFNFYKKKIKKFNLEIYLILKDNKIYAADNLGYIYALDLQNFKILWAKNNGIPFRSNIKLADDQIFISDQDNNIYSLDIQNGESIWKFATNPTPLKTKFKNNIAIDFNNKNIFFLNTSGQLYSINYIQKNINWVINLKPSILSESNNIFESTPIALKNENIYLSYGKKLSQFNLRGKNNWNRSIATYIKPIITQKNIFLFSKNNFLICLDVENGSIVWSKDFTSQIKNIKELTKRKIGNIQHIYIVNNNILLFSSNGYSLIFNYLNGDLISYSKIVKSKITSKPIFAKGKTFIFDSRFKLNEFQLSTN